MFGPNHVSDAPFELLDKGAVVGQPAAVEHVIDASEESLPIAEIGTPDVEFLGECRRAAEYRKIGNGVFHEFIERVLRNGLSEIAARA
jgi:hypothetical protein